MNIGEKIKHFGVKKFGSVMNFADALGISQPNLSQYLSDKHKPGISLLLKLNKVGCDLNWLFSNDDEEPIKWVDDEALKMQQQINELQRQIELFKSVLSQQMIDQLLSAPSKKKK